MGSSWIVIAASLLGVVSIALIAGSLWASGRTRKRPRPPAMVSGAYVPVPYVSPAPLAPVYAAPPTSEHTLITAAPSPYPAPDREPPVDQATQFLTVDDIFALADDRVEPTQILSDDDLRIATPVEPVVRARVIETPRSAIPASPSPMPRSAIPAASIPNPASIRPSPIKPAAAPASTFAPPDPSAFMKPVDTQPAPYVGYVAPRGADDDEDDDEDDDDPETELVHQAELMRLMMKSKPPQ